MSVRVWVLMVAFGACCLPARAGLPDPVKSVLTKAIKAVGCASPGPGQAITFDSHSKIKIDQLNLELDGQWAMQGHDRLNGQLSLNLKDTPIKLTVVVNGDQGWAANPQTGKTEPMQAKDIANFLVMARVLRFAQCPAFLLDPSLKLAPLGEVMINQSPAVGFKIAQLGHKDLSLYFDKATGLPAKAEFPVQEVLGGASVMYAFHFYDFKDIKGVNQFTRVLLYRNQQQVMEMQFSKIQLHEKLNEKLFAKP
jgi:hypothetical protein